jgi:type I restriction enzyme S subunit
VNCDRLLAQFDRLGEAPDAVPTLRRFILDLAARGDLVEHDPDDRPASELIARTSLIDTTRPTSRNGSSAGSKTTSSITLAVPPIWEPIRLVEVAQVSYGFAFDSSRFNTNQSGMPLIRIRDISNATTEAYYDGEFDPRYIVKPGDYLVGMDGNFNVRKWRGGEALLNQRVMRIREWSEGVVADFMAILLQSYLDLLHVGTSQTTVKHLSAKQVETIVLPLPPFNEQRRIVAKVDELMALCDRLEAAQLQRERRRDRLAVAALKVLSGCSYRDRSGVTGGVALDAMTHYLARPDQVSGLRATILGLGMKGCLVPQETSDGSVETQLSAADAVRAATSRHDRRAEAGQQPLLAADQRWEVPSSWDWRGLADLVLFIDYRGKTPTKVNAGVPLITAKNVKRGFIDREPREFIAKDEFERWMTRGLPRAGDVLFTTEAPMGNVSVVQSDERFALAQRVIDFRPYGAVDPDYLALFLLSPDFQGLLDRTATGLTAKGIKAAKLKRLPIAIPPMLEQRRIVAKVDKLMAVCDDLERSLAAVQTGRARLLDAVLREALAEGAPGRSIPVLSR